jgi:arabinogalactan oligomer/maltooligosaccharide transport system substrate-binding protein
MKRKLWSMISILLIAVMLLTACASTATQEPVESTEVQPAATEEQPMETEAAMTAEVTEPAVEETQPAEPPMEAVNIVLWTKEGEADGGLQYVQSLADAFTAEHPEVTFEVVNKDVETLREDFQTASLAGAPPDLLWTVNDHAGPFTAAQLIMPVDDMFDLSKYVDSAVAAVELDGQTWGVPISNGNHLMLLYNKELVPDAPEDTDAMISVGQDITVEGTDTVTGTYGLVYNQTEPFWLVPWLGGFGGKVFEDDGVTPNLNTPEMVSTLQFLHDIKFQDNIVPAESDYNGADALFKEGKAGMIINGDWSLGDYKDLFGDNLGVARIPMVTATGLWPAPYTSGVFFMIPEGLEGAKLDAVKAFIDFSTNEDNQLDMVETLTRLPALKVALDNPLITDDPLLAGSAEQMTVGTPMPTVLEMRCNWDAMKPEMQAVLADTKTAEQAAADMQSAAENCVLTLD